MRDYVDEQTLLTEDLARIERYFGEARAVAGELGINLRLPRTRVRIYPPGTPGRERCNWPWNGAYISYRVTPCPAVWCPLRPRQPGQYGRPGCPAGLGRRRVEAFRAQLASDTPPDVCQSCSLYHGTF